MTGALDWAEGAPPPPVYPSPSRSSCAPPLPPSSLKHLVGLVGELPQTHHSSASHPSSVANAAAITASLQACAEWGGWGGGGALCCRRWRVYVWGRGSLCMAPVAISSYPSLPLPPQDGSSLTHIGLACIWRVLDAYALLPLNSMCRLLAQNGAVPRLFVVLKQVGRGRRCAGTGQVGTDGRGVFIKTRSYGPLLFERVSIYAIASPVDPPDCVPCPAQAIPCCQHPDFCT